MNKIWIFGQIINELGKTFFREYERGCLLTVVSAGGLFLFPEVGRNYFLVIPTGYSIMRIEKYRKIWVHGNEEKAFYSCNYR